LIAPRLAKHPIEGQGLGRNGVQPLAFAGDGKAGLIEMPLRSISNSSLARPKQIPFG
jgi:hypothetical protein